ncbi:MAG: DUF2029 domain-containing protein [Chloroflexota bacterium]|nr:DUF2029 domain-containing protein [Chloroflexota bacterium]
MVGAVPEPMRAGRPTLFWIAGMGVALAGLLVGVWAWAQFVRAQEARAPHGYLAQTDFNLLFAHARLIAAGQGDKIYDFATQHAAQLALIEPNTQLGGGQINHYWPILGGLLVPVAGWSPEAALILWVGLSAVAFTIALGILLRELGYDWRGGLLFAVAAWAFIPHIIDLEQAQTTDLLMLPLICGILALRRGADWQAGLWLGLLGLKPQLTPVWIIAMLAAGRLRGLAGFAACTGVLLGVSTLLSGPGWLGAWWELSRYSLNLPGGHGFDVALSHNFRELMVGLPGGASGTLNPIQLAVSALVGLGVAAIWWRTPATAGQGVSGNYRLALTVLAMLISSPYLDTHDLAFWLPAGAFLLAPAPAAADSLPNRRLWIGLSWAGWALAWPAVLLLTSSPIKIAAFYMVGVTIMILWAWWRTGTPVLRRTTRAPAA